VEFQTGLIMSGGAYRNFVRVLEKWPVDKNKAGKDLGEALRTSFSKSFPSGSTTKVDEKLLNKQISAIDSLIADKSRNAHQRQSKSTFTGLDLETLSQITTTEMMNQASKESSKKLTFFQKLRNIRVR